MKKLSILFLTLIVTSAIWASNTITYMATSKLPEITVIGPFSSGLYVNAFNVAITDHSFSNGNGIITFAGEVTSIGEKAFYGCSSLTSITIPYSVTSIGDDAFQGCISLPVEDNIRYADTYLVEAVNKTSSYYMIKNGTKWIGHSAFYDCSSLTSITIPYSVISIGGSVFSQCSSLTSITIPNSVTSIGDYVFSGCSKLTTVTIPNGVTTIGDYVFSGCSKLTTVTIPNGVTSIGVAAFDGCSSLTSITIPNSVTSIGYQAFDDCTSLPVENNLRYADTYLVGAVDTTHSTYTIKKGTIWIGDYAFYGCTSLRSITIPNSVIRIGDYAFGGCTSIQSITIPNSVISIGGSAFSQCSSLTSITIPSSVTSIDEGTFSPCSSLSNITVDASNTHYASIDGVLFDYAKNTLIQYPIGNTRTSYTIPSSVTSIGSEAFYDCTTLTSLIIPHSLISMGLGSFFGCSSLTSITCYATTPPDGSDSFYGVDKSIPVYVPINSIDAYKTADEWKDFTNILAITVEEVPAPTTVVTTPSDNSVTITWPTTNGAESYTIVIKKGGVTFCTLTFNAQGQLLTVAFAPGRGSSNDIAMAEAVSGGYKFTITSLTPGTKYNYEVYTKNASGTSLANYSGTFTTTSTPTSLDQLTDSPVNRLTKVIKDGQLYILREGKMYNAQGGEVSSTGVERE